MPTTQQSYTSFLEGVRSYQQKQFTKSIQHFTESFYPQPSMFKGPLNLPSSSFQPLLNLSSCYIKSQEYTKALQGCFYLIQLQPYLSICYYNLCSVYIRQQKFDLAVNTLKCALSCEFLKKYERIFQKQYLDKAIQSAGNNLMARRYRLTRNLDSLKNTLSQQYISLLTTQIFSDLQHIQTITKTYQIQITYNSSKQQSLLIETMKPKFTLHSSQLFKISTNSLKIKSQLQIKLQKMIEVKYLRGEYLKMLEESKLFKQDFNKIKEDVVKFIDQQKERNRQCLENQYQSQGLQKFDNEEIYNILCSNSRFDSSYERQNTFQTSFQSVDQRSFQVNSSSNNFLCLPPNSITRKCLKTPKTLNQTTKDYISFNKSNTRLQKISKRHYIKGRKDFKQKQSKIKDKQNSRVNYTYGGRVQDKLKAVDKSLLQIKNQRFNKNSEFPKKPKHQTHLANTYSSPQLIQSKVVYPKNKNLNQPCSQSFELSNSFPNEYKLVEERASEKTMTLNTRQTHKQQGVKYVDHLNVLQLVESKIRDNISSSIISILDYDSEECNDNKRYAQKQNLDLTQDDFIDKSLKWQEKQPIKQLSIHKSYQNPSKCLRTPKNHQAQACKNPTSIQIGSPAHTTCYLLTQKKSQHSKLLSCSKCSFKYSSQNIEYKNLKISINLTQLYDSNKILSQLQTFCVVKYKQQQHKTQSSKGRFPNWTQEIYLNMEHKQNKEEDTQNITVQLWAKAINRSPVVFGCSMRQSYRFTLHNQLLGVGYLDLINYPNKLKLKLKAKTKITIYQPKNQAINNGRSNMRKDDDLQRRKKVAYMYVNMERIRV